MEMQWERLKPGRLKTTRAQALPPRDKEVSYATSSLRTGGTSILR